MEVLWDFVFMLICWIKSVYFCCSWFETIEDELLYSLPVGTSSYAHCWHLRINCFTDCHPNSFVLRAVFPKIRNSDLEDAGDVFLEKQQRKENRCANAQFLQACGLWIMFQQIFILFCLVFSCKLAQRGGRSSKAVWTWSWATCCGCLCFSRGWTRRTPEGPASLSHSVIMKIWSINSRYYLYWNRTSV